MKFKSFKGKMVMCKNKIITFKTEEYETKCEDEIKALKGALKVEEVKSRKSKSQD